MADEQVVALAATGATATGALVAAVRGRVTPLTAAHLRDGLAKLLAEGLPVLLDVSALRLEWAPGPEVFVTAVAGAGGWPAARMVLFGADQHTTDRLLACRVPASVPLARTVDEASALVEVRPARLSAGADLPAGPEAVDQARAVVRGTLDRWAAPDLRDDAEAVTTELVRNAVEHARTPTRLRLILDDGGLRVSVRDGRPGGLPTSTPRGGGLRAVARRSRTWGTLEYGDSGKSVWAQLPPAHAGPVPVGDEEPPGGAARARAGRARSALRVSAPRRRRFATADPEIAQAFLRTVYGEHTLRLSGADPSAHFQLEYDGVTTDRFAVERLTHRGAVQTRLTAAEALVVVHVLDGDLRVATRDARTRVGAGEVLLCRGGKLVLASTGLDAEVVRIGVAAFRRLAAEVAGLDAATAPTYLAPPASARAGLWRATVAHLRRDVLGDEGAPASAEYRLSVLRHLVATLVEAFPAVRGGPDQPGRVPAAPAAVRRAIAFIEERAPDDIGLAEIAAAAGVGARGLQMAFRKHAGTTPLEYLRGVRIAAAHRELQAADAGEVTVGAVAARWGFPHHGTFSTLYLRAYGCSPSMTLRS